MLTSSFGVACLALVVGYLFGSIPFGMILTRLAGTQDLLAWISAAFDKWIVDGLLVRGSAMAAWGGGFLLRLFQFGNLQGYAFLFGAGVVALIFYVVFAH